MSINNFIIYVSFNQFMYTNIDVQVFKVLIYITLFWWKKNVKYQTWRGLNNVLMLNLNQIKSVAINYVLYGSQRLIQHWNCHGVVYTIESYLKGYRTAVNLYKFSPHLF